MQSGRCHNDSSSNAYCAILLRAHVQPRGPNFKIIMHGMGLGSVGGIKYSDDYPILK